MIGFSPADPGKAEIAAVLQVGEDAVYRTLHAARHIAKGGS